MSYSSPRRRPYSISEDKPNLICYLPSKLLDALANCRQLDTLGMDKIRSARPPSPLP